jgi:hypothetical protein
MEAPVKKQRLRNRRSALLGLALVLPYSCGGSRKMASEPAPKQSVALPNHAHKAAPARALAPAEAPAVPSSARASKLIQDELDRLPVGQIAFNPPAAMREGAAERIEVRVAEAKAASALPEMSGNVQTEPIRVSPVMSVQLQGASFHITPLDPQDQIVTSDGFTQWDFDVTPVASGDQTLSLTASVEIAVPGFGPQRRAFPVLSRTVHVQVNPVGFLTDNWQWFAGTILIPLAVFAYQKMVKRQVPAKPLV